MSVTRQPNSAQALHRLTKLMGKQRIMAHYLSADVGETTCEQVKVKRFRLQCAADDEQQEDLVQMVNVDTANILNTLRVRHKAGAVYTSVGQVGIVISVNPYRKIDICARVLRRTLCRLRRLSTHAILLSCACSRKSRVCLQTARS